MTFNELYRRVGARKLPFFMVFFFVVLITYALLYAVDFYPEPIGSTTTTEPETETAIEPVEETTVEPVVESVSVRNVSAHPTQIIFDSLDKTVPVLNPEGSDISTLDAALLSGAVRHPESADFQSDGNMFILAHSSYLPNVLNKHFQAFNGIQDLTWGDKIRVQSADTEYIYRVEKVYQATTEAVVEPTPGEARLTLATCNSFGSKEDRYMVEAKLIDTRTL